MATSHTKIRIEAVNLARISKQYGLEGSFQYRDYYADQFIGLVGIFMSDVLYVRDPRGKRVKVYTATGKKSTPFWKCLNRWCKESTWKNFDMKVEGSVFG